MWIIDQSIRNLVQRIDKGEEPLDLLLTRLIAKLQKRCAHPKVVARYAQYGQQLAKTAKPAAAPRLPLDQDGYVIGFDPLTQEKAFIDSWNRYGIVVGANVVSQSQCQEVVARMHELLLALSEGTCDLSKPSTWNNVPVDQAGVPIISRGFFEIYHDQTLASIRQSVRVYLHYVLIWGRADLWTTFDRLGIKLPGLADGKALPLHVDQNPNVHPDFRTVQGVLALADCPAERGTFVGVPGSRDSFSVYGSMAKNQGEYVELDLSHDIAAEFTASAQLCPLRAGHLISWDSRTTHANSSNVSEQTRTVAYIAFGPQRQSDESACQARQEAFESGLGSNVRDALMHASKRPRFTNQTRLAALRRSEKLTKLGRLIYGQEKY
jgi:hypothetical protein